MPKLLSSPTVPAAALALLVTPLALARPAQDAPRATSVLALDPVGRSGRTAVVTDAVLARIASGAWMPPREGEEVRAPDGASVRWRAASLDESGALSGEARRGAWVAVSVDSPREQVLLLDARGHSLMYAGGEPRMGDLYSLGLSRTPVALREGSNELLFKASRGGLRLAWEAAPAAVFLEERDSTLPDLVRGEREPLWAGVVVTNATREWQRGWKVAARAGDGRALETELPAIAPLEVRKCAIRFGHDADPESDSCELRAALLDDSGAQRFERAYPLAVRSANSAHKRTFASEVDGSVQYYAAQPPARAVGEQESLALILSLHGASVEAWNQATSYAPKDDAYVVAPTNRRPFGFDWEDWGRRDAMEVLALARSRYRTDELRTYLTGHSMGGHGTWQLGVHYPDVFAAIAPSAGWIDFWSYMGVDDAPPSDPVGAMLHRASNPSRTLLLARNLAPRGVYVLHGDADDNVPVTQARRMRTELATFHADFAYYERPGAGHWWGNPCVDWPPLVDFLRRHSLDPGPAPLRVELRKVDPAIRGRVHWIELWTQERALEPSAVEAVADPAAARITVTTANVESFALSALRRVAPDGTGEAIFDGWSAEAPAKLSVDGVEVELPALDRVLFVRRDAGGWRARTEWPREWKSPLHAGPFKAAFDSRFVLVYGTRGDEHENAWSLAKARFDAEQFRYRGNASPLVISDDECRAGAGTTWRECNLILYGNEATNGAWNDVVDSTEFRVARGALHVGGRRLAGDGLGCLAVRPRRDAHGQLVGLVGGAGLAGMRSTDHLPYFVSGAGFPDWIVLRADFLEHGLDGFVGAGFFRTDWSVDPAGGSAWAELESGR